MFLCEQVSGGGVATAHSSALSALNVDAVCEKLKQIEGIDQSMLAQYTATIRKVSFNALFLIILKLKLLSPAKL